MPSTKQDAIDYVATSDMDADDKAYWKGQQNPFQPTFTLTLPPLASEFKMTDRVFADVKTRLYTKSTHAKTSLLVVLPGGPTKSGVDRDADFAAQFGTDFIIFDVPPLEMGKRNSVHRYDQLAKAFFEFIKSNLKEEYQERKLIAASAGCYDGILLAFYAAAPARDIPFTAFAAIAPVTWSLKPEDVDRERHAPGLCSDRMGDFCKPAMQYFEKFDDSVPPNLYNLADTTIARLPKMLFVIAKHDVLCSSGLKFARRVSNKTKNVTIALANGPHQVKDSPDFAAHNAVTTCIRDFLAGEEISSFDPKLLKKVSGSSQTELLFRNC